MRAFRSILGHRNGKSLLPPGCWIWSDSSLSGYPDPTVGNHILLCATKIDSNSEDNDVCFLFNTALLAVTKTCHRFQWAVFIFVGLVQKLLALLGYMLVVFGLDPSMQPRVMYFADVTGNSLVALLFVMEACWEYSSVQLMAKQALLTASTEERESSLL